MACAPWNPIGCAASLAKTAAGDAFSSIAHDFGHMADAAVNWLWAQTNDATAVRLGGTGFHVDLGIVATIAVTVAVGLFVIQVMASALRRDPGGLGRAAKGLVVAFVGAGIAIAATNVLLAAVDALSAGVVQAATGQSLPQVGRAILTGAAISQATSNPAGIIIFAMAALIAVAIVWAALTVRKVLIVISAVFAPLAFAGSLADITASWVRRWIEVTVALIVSKLILVIIFVIGLDMLVEGVGQAGSGGTQRATQAVSGLLVLAVAGFAPWLALKLVHWSGDQFHQIHGLALASAGGAYKAVQAPQKAMPWVTGGRAGALAGSRSTGTGGSAPGPITSEPGAGRTGGAGPSSGALSSTQPGGGEGNTSGGGWKAAGDAGSTVATINGADSPGSTPPARRGDSGGSTVHRSPADSPPSASTSTIEGSPVSPAPPAKAPHPDAKPAPAPRWPTSAPQKERQQT
jgi:hypothetical protein